MSSNVPGSGSSKPFILHSNPMWRVLISDPLDKEETKRLCNVVKVAQLIYLGTSLDDPTELSFPCHSSILYHAGGSLSFTEPGSCLALSVIDCDTG